ncbi:hypothetical protein [Mycolicibacter longobardus]|uniref:hypothetical protein n=1 Tax=Mycolicibacter longobardus TaxID=1108812 RepID=UPI001055AB51|nr:hypothetical protein [Mycolicibacter longobardus]MCV7383743.1 hypothetical protein [Mycolicibacter longobardus]
MAPTPADVERLVAGIRSAITLRKTPGGWPENIELALIDAVLSIRARYGVTADTGVRGAIKRYQADSGRTGWDDLRILGDINSARLSEVLANRQKTGGALKTEAIVDAARRLAEAGVVHAADVDRNSDKQKSIYCGTRGLGPVTWSYFLMLLGTDGVKPDTLVTRFVSEAVGGRPGPDAVTALVTAAAECLEMSSSDLDHSIWRHMSNPRRS